MKKIISPILAAALLLSGCGKQGSIYTNYRETEHLLPVQTLGLDSSPQGLKLSVSCTPTGEGGSPTVISRDGRSILAAMDSLQDYSAGGQLYYPHTRFVLLGEDYARSGMEEALDFLARDGRMRMGIMLFVAREESAKSLITGPEEGKSDITAALSSLRRDSALRGSSPPFTARETIRSLSEAGAALVSAVKIAETEGSVFSSSGGKTAVAEGYAIIKDARLLDYLDERLSAAACIVLDRGGSTAPSLHLSGTGEAGLVMDSSKLKIKPQWNTDGSLELIRVHCSLRAGLDELRSATENVITRENMEAMAQQLEEDMKDTLEQLFAKSRELDADFLDLMSYLRQDKAAFADALPDDWLSKARFEISVEARLKDAGDMGNMMNTDGWGR